ncbi:MAG: hypothetical protein ACJATU_000929 [Rickettsiales bacterium]|jgi:hypothetical protein
MPVATDFKKVFFIIDKKLRLKDHRKCDVIILNKGIKK